MKYIIVVVSLFAYTYAVDKEFIRKFLDEIEKVSETCIPESKASKADLSSLLAHNPPESHEAKCLVFCYHKHFNVQNADGSINVAGAMQALQPLKEHDAEVYDKVLRIFQTCATSVVSQSDPCEFAGDLATCSLKEGKALGLDEVLLLE